MVFSGPIGENLQRETNKKIPKPSALLTEQVSHSYFSSLSSNNGPRHFDVIFPAACREDAAVPGTHLQLVFRGMYHMSGHKQMFLRSLKRVIDKMLLTTGWCRSHASAAKP